MIEVISGKDWSCSSGEGIKQNLFFDVPVNDADNEQDDKDVKINPYEYFPIWSSLFGNSGNINPINLGIYLDTEWKIHSTQFVGIMPLTDKNLKPFKHNNEQCVIKIDSRFHISPSEILKEVLNGDDYYENPDMLQCNSYKLSELKELFGKNKKSKVLCGTVRDVGKVTLKQSDIGNGNKSDKLDSILSSAYPIFEIIRFVSLAKEVCKKSLKQQSVFKEENLVGKVKGRILINKQIKQNLSRGQYHKTYCAYNSLSDHIKENIILKYTLHLCSKFEIADSLREDIMFCNRVLANVPLKKCSISDFVGLKCNGVFRQYKQAMDAAKTIIKRYYISYNQSDVKDGSEENNEGGMIKVTDYSVEPYFIDMNLLFEYYCRALFRKAINRYNQENRDHILEMDSATRGNIQLFNEKNKVKAFYMQTYIPDILIRYRQKDNVDDKILAVIDAKYSDVEHSAEKRARTHQMLFYMNVLNCNYGGLISPRLNLPEENSYLMDSYLYDGKNESRQKLCYLPLNKVVLEENSNESPYDEMVYSYLEEIMEDKIKKDEEEQRQLELAKAVKEILGMISTGVGNKQLSGKKDMKQGLLKFYDKFSYMIDNSEENTKGE